MSLAIVRGVPRSFVRALRADPAPLDLPRAQAQHAGYVAVLAGLGLKIVALAADEDCPDCCFVEDTAVVAGGIALLARPGAPSRRAEVDAVAAVLPGAVERLAEPATLDGGDCLRAGRRIYVGRSRRTNALGIARLAQVFHDFEVVPVRLPPGVLHLKSVCSPLADDLVLVAEGTIPPQTFGRALVVPAAEAHAANAVAVDGAALVAADCPRAAALVEQAGFRAIPVDTSELRKADGALTCLSILVLDSA